MPTKQGFQQPVGRVMRLRLDRLRATLKKNSPVGKPRPSGYRVGKRFYSYRKPYTPGTLRDSWDNKDTVRLSKSGKTVLIVNDLPQAHTTSKGARPHIIRAKRAKFLMFKKGGKVRFKESVNHPGNEGTNWIRKSIREWASKFEDAPRTRFEPYRGIKLEP
jgi:hypothetical protein